MTAGRRQGVATFAALMVVVGCIPAAASARTHTFSGRCSFQGNVHFTPPATNSQQSLTAAYRATGTCSGKLDGRTVSNARVSAWNTARRVDGSCLHADTTQPGKGAIRFGRGTTIGFSSEFHFVSTHGEISLEGERSGSAHGVGSFVTQRTPPDIPQRCAGEGVADAPLDITVATDSPLAGGGGQAKRGRLADFSTAYTTRVPGRPTGLRVHVLFHRPGDRNAKPSPLRSAVVRGPAGLRFDTTTLPRCTASDNEIRALGTKACPAASELTVGKFSAVTGFGPPVDPLAGDDHVYNGRNQLIEIITPPNGFIAPAFDRLTISGSTLTAHPPKAPGGPPEGETSVRSLDFAIPVRTRRGKALIRTPRRCPRSRRWVTRATFGFADGSRETVRSTARCVRPKRRR